jgi:hypothetical protein
MSLSSGRYVHKTQQTEETNIHAVSGIRTHNPSSLAAADVRLSSVIGIGTYLLRTYM